MFEPEVTMVVSKIGRTELGNDPQEPNESDPVVVLKPVEAWTTAGTRAGLVDKIREQLERIPGASFLLSQPIQQRVDELISGVRTEATVKLFGDDLELLRTTAVRIAVVLGEVRGVKDVRVEQLFGQPYLTILLSDAAGAVIPLSDMGTIRLEEGPGRISREGLQRRIYIGFNTSGRDIGSIVAEAQERIAARVPLPSGYHLAWGGSFENMQRARARLTVIVPLTIGLIFLLLFSSFDSVRFAALIILNLPFALVGGTLALWVTGEYLSVPASVGFINLFGVAVLNGIVLVSYINKLHREGLRGEEAIVQGCLLRLRPVLMKALVALVGLIPLALAQGIGSEVQRPLATVVIGGLLSSTLLTLIVLPVLYPWFAGTERQVEG